MYRFVYTGESLKQFSDQVATAGITSDPQVNKNCDFNYVPIEQQPGQIALLFQYVYMLLCSSIVANLLAITLWF